MTRTTLSMAVLAAALAGCGGLGGADANYIKPTIAVMKFDSRAAFPIRWDIGGGMRDILVDRLVATGRYHVIERPELAAVLKEIQFQQSGATRRHRRAQPGRLKNVEYLIKGTVTDFGHVSTHRGFGSLGSLDVFGGGQRAVLGLTLYVVDVESGEILCSHSIEESVRAGDATVKAAYKDVAFGGSVFYRTPLGRATAHAIDKAVRRVSRTVAARRWVPKVAAVQPDGQAVLNGGKNRRVRPGTRYEVVTAGEPVVDPDTGDVLGARPGQPVGTLEVTRVRDRYSLAELVAGDPSALKVGQRCRPAPQPAGAAERPAP